MSCDRDYGIANYPICSGNGQCVNDFCVCNSGWTSYADWEINNGYDCDINILSIRLLGGLITFFGSISIYYILEFLFTLNRYNSLKIASQHLLLGLIYFIKLSCFFIFGVAKLVDPVKYCIGNNNRISHLITFCCAIATAMIGLSSGLFIIITGDYVHTYSKMMDGESRTNLLNKIK